jgi:alpha-1,6-mannosyltransferase
LDSVVAARTPAHPATAGPRSQSRARAWIGPPAVLCGLVLIAATVEIVLDASLEHSPLVPKSPHIATWLRSLGGERLGYRTFLIAILASSVAYGVLLALMRTRIRDRDGDPRAGGARVTDDAPVTDGKRVTDGERAPAGDLRASHDPRTARWAIGLVALLNLIVFAGPILISTDVFSYLAYARMGVVHGINPYLHGPVAISGDPVFHYVGHNWLRVDTAYGPLYTLLSYPLATLGLVGGLWGMKVYALIASALTLALTWRVARRRGHDEVFALLAVGANPLYVIYGLGGAHNDLIMLALMMGAVAFTLSDRDAAAGATVVAGALVKATVAALLPFMILGRRRLAPALGALAALALCALAGYLAFGVHGIDVVSALNRDSAFVSTDSFPNEIAHLFGKPGVFPIDHDLLKAALVLIVLHLLWRTYRGYDWVAASGWALLAISVTSTWLLAWYILWPLPLAVITRDRRLLLATLAVQALFIAHQTSPLFAPVS